MSNIEIEKQNEIIEDMITLFMNQKVTKDIIIKLLDLYKIPRVAFNMAILSKIKRHIIRPAHRTHKYMCADIRSEYLNDSTEVLREKEAYRYSNAISHKEELRMLSTSELTYKIQQHSRCYGLAKNIQPGLVDVLATGIETYIKNLADKHNGKFCKQSVKDKLKKACCLYRADHSQFL